MEGERDARRCRGREGRKKGKERRPEEEGAGEMGREKEGEGKEEREGKGKDRRTEVEGRGGGRQESPRNVVGRGEERQPKILHIIFKLFITDKLLHHSVCDKRLC